MFRRPVPRGELVEEAAASEEEEVDSWSTSDEEEQEDSRDYCKGQGTERELSLHGSLHGRVDSTGSLADKSGVVGNMIEHAPI